MCRSSRSSWPSSMSRPICCVVGEDRICFVAFDWCYPRDGVGQAQISVLVRVDLHSGTKCAFAAKDKNSNNPSTIREVLNCLRQMGHHGSVTLQTDSESSLHDLMKHVACQRDSPTFLRVTPKADSQANGRVERAIRSVEECARTQNLDVQRRAGDLLSVTDTAFLWLIRHSVNLLNWRQPGI